MQGIGTTERQLRLLQTLAGTRQGETVADLARQFVVNQRTIRRDLQRLQAIGFPVDQTTEAHGRQRWLLHGNSIVGTGLTFDEAFALVLASDCLTQLDGTPLADAMQSAVGKLSKQFSPSTRRYCKTLARTIALQHPRSVDYSRSADWLLEILIAHEDRKDVLIEYESRGSTEPVTFGLSPYAIRFYNAAIYVIGYSERHGEIRTFKLDRIRSARNSEFPFTIPDDFDADAYLADAFGIHAGGVARLVKIGISRRASGPLSESKWHASQQVESRADGSSIFSFQVAINEELVSWILSCGADATVLEPPELVAQVKQQLAAMTSNYNAEEAQA